MPYGRKYKRRSFKKRTFKRFAKRKGYRKKDYTPVVKVEQYYFVKIGTDAGSGNGNSHLYFTPTEGVNEYTNVIAFSNVIGSATGSFSKYSSNYGTYKVIGCGIEFTWSKEMATISGSFADSSVPFIGCTIFPAETNALTPTAIMLKQQDQFFQVPPRLGTFRKYQRYPPSYINNTLSAVGVGTWNSVTNKDVQLGAVAIMNVSENKTNNGAPGARVTVGYVKVNIYVRFGSKKI